MIERSIWGKTSSALWQQPITWLVMIHCWCITPRITVADTFALPSSPEVPPIISETYSNDSDRDCIDDVLYLKISRARGGSIDAPQLLMLKEGGNPLDEIVDVQVLFNTPIAGQQIDRFSQLGGEIAYIYRALAYGWTGRIKLGKIDLLPAAMGPTLVLVEEPPRIELHLDTATQIGRVRPVWREDFAGSPLGFDGDESITIGIIDTGIDANHPDLAGQWIDWSDYSDDKQDSPMDKSGHGSHVAGIVAGTGDAGNLAGEVLRWTDIGEPNSPSVGLYRIPLTDESRTLTTTPYFTSQSGGAHVIHLYYWLNPPFGDGVTSFSWYRTLRSGGQRTSSVPTDHPEDDYYECAYLASADENLVVVNSITPHSPVGDGFNRFRGVAPGCCVAAAKIFLDDPNEGSILAQGALADFADRRKELSLKIVNLSLGVKGMLVISDSLRECVNNAVRNGIVVVSSAGNGGDNNTPEQRQIHDPGRAALALTVGAVNDRNRLTEYSSHGFDPNDNNPVAQQDDYKPDVIAPGGSKYHIPRFTYYPTPSPNYLENYRHAIMSVDSGSADGPAWPDLEPNDYTNMVGTSMAAPFVSGCAGLVIDALQQRRLEAGVNPNDLWDFYSANDALFVKTVLCATATETNEAREDANDLLSPTLQRAEPGPIGYPAGKDPYEGYGIVNADAAVEAVFLEYKWGSSESDVFGENPTDRRAWARRVVLSPEIDYHVKLVNPPDGDFDLYLYSGMPSPTGTPRILASSTNAALGGQESIAHTSLEQDDRAILVVKRVAGWGEFQLTNPN